MDAIAQLRQAKDAGKQLAQTAEDLKTRFTDLVREYGQVLVAPAPQEECVANINRLVDGIRQGKDNAMRPMLAHAVSGGLDRHVQTDGSIRAYARPPKLPPFGDQVNAVGVLTFNDLCWLCPDLVKARLAEVLSGSARFGLPKQARREKLAELDAQIADVETQHAELVIAAAEVGIDLSPLNESTRNSREAHKQAATSL